MTEPRNKGLKGLLDARDRGWVRVANIAWQKSTMRLDIAIDMRRNGTTLEVWSVECKNVREYRVSDVNGGGLAIYADDHPTVHLYRDEVVSLRFRGKAKQVSRMLGELLCAHEQTVGDWVAFDRYLGNVSALIAKLEFGRGVLAQGPKFLMSSYADVLRNRGLKPQLVGSKQQGRGHALALHFGNSFVVARSIRAQRITGHDV